MEGIPNDPIELFERWYQEAEASGQPMADAFALATATAEGRPSVRYLLQKGVNEAGLTFFTNHESRKADELDANPQAAASFYWSVRPRQVRFEGRVERVSDEESDAYFASRPRESQFNAWASPQSRPVPSYEELTRLHDEVAQRFDGQTIPRPEFWGGYRLVPDVVEFWEQRDFRAHWRLCFKRAGKAWTRTLLGP